MTRRPISQKGDFCIITDRNFMDVDAIHEFLSSQSYWAKGIPQKIVGRALRNCLPFGVFKDEQQIGLARVVTDYATYAYIADVYILDGFRGIGLGAWLMETILSHPRLRQVRHWALGTVDAQAFYMKFGFKCIDNPENHMFIFKDVSW